MDYIETPSGGKLKVGDKVKAFHPLAMGVMHSGTVRKFCLDRPQPLVQVGFVIDRKSYWIPLDHVDVFCQ